MKFAAIALAAFAVWVSASPTIKNALVNRDDIVKVSGDVNSAGDVTTSSEEDAGSYYPIAKRGSASDLDNSIKDVSGETLDIIAKQDDVPDEATGVQDDVSDAVDEAKNDVQGVAGDATDFEAA